MALQFGVVPIRHADGEMRVLLVTSRETRRWVVPRGNPIANLSPEQTAAQEAYEEAGVRGPVHSPSIGTYRYDKRKRNGAVVPTEVRLFTMIVEEELDSWPERNQRERRWFAPDEAAAAVDEADLKRLLQGLPASLC